ncbi:hypothetical protein DFA_08740 [Cavenderia fasciculata]|uniref:Transmembrane protein n=1 Tax=Cavenderia fasciculata TaxID=261658 RepID=F4Q3Y5_CACFS|nr:uncharacterized protein DFA_08740 [Cavenderia fasciculata]EGG17741.1 hypothetical protein DFA_08740 [Cavenderia fasciculata]|eukprot:XP_004356225.1 hypothetical protein DFA_08740 [Cavenderia fasciculata]
MSTLQRVSSTIERLTKSKVIFIVLFLVTIYTFILLQENVVGRMGGNPALDSFFGYGPEKGHKVMSQMTYAEKETYLGLYTKGYDIVIPFLLTYLPCALISFTMPSSILNTVPLLYMLGDYAENITHYFIILDYMGTYTNAKHPLDSMPSPNTIMLLRAGGFFALFKYVFFVLFGLIKKLFLVEREHHGHRD